MKALRGKCKPFLFKGKPSQIQGYLLQPATTTDVQTKFSYLSALAGKSTDKVNSGFEM